MSQARNGVPSKEDLEAAMKTENNEVVGTLKLTTFSAVIDEVMPQIQEQIALRVRTLRYQNCPIMIVSTKQILHCYIWSL